MTSEPTRDPTTDSLLTPQNCALLVIDYQPSQFATVTSIDRNLLTRNIVSVARLAKAYGLPIVLSTVNVAANGQPPTIPELREVLSDLVELDRTQINSWEDVDFRRAVEATGRKKLVMTALWTVPGLPRSRRAARGLRGLPGRRRSGRDLSRGTPGGLERIVQAGAQPIGWVSLACELQRDLGSNRHRPRGGRYRAHLSTHQGDLNRRVDRSGISPVTLWAPPGRPRRTANSDSRGSGYVSSRWTATSAKAFATAPAAEASMQSRKRPRTLARCTGHADFSLAMPWGLSLATLPRASEALAVFVTRPRDWRSSTRRVIRLADKSVAVARSAIRSSRLGASDRCMIVVYSLAVRPAPLVRSLSNCCGMILMIRIRARQSTSSVGESGSRLAMPSRITCSVKQLRQRGAVLPQGRGKGQCRLPLGRHRVGMATPADVPATGWTSGADNHGVGPPLPSPTGRIRATI